VELSPEDARERGIGEGDLLEVTGRRGIVRAPARISAVRPGTVFIPFHYGYWDTDHPTGPGDGPGRAANELTMSAWDPVSKQPLFKAGAVSVRRVAGRDGPAPAPLVTASAPVGGG
jgi:anaerobic selenocysteine-containing dehydrogenase